MTALGQRPVRILKRMRTSGCANWSVMTAYVSYHSPRKRISAGVGMGNTAVFGDLCWFSSPWKKAFLRQRGYPSSEKSKYETLAVSPLLLEPNEPNSVYTGCSVKGSGISSGWLRRVDRPYRSDTPYTHVSRSSRHN